MKGVNLGDKRNLENNPEIKSRFNDFMIQKYQELGDDKASEYFNTNPEFRGLLKTINKGKLYIKDVLAFFDKKEQEIITGSKVKLNFGPQKGIEGKVIEIRPPLIVGHELAGEQYKVRWDEEQYGESDWLNHNEIKKVVKISVKNEKIEKNKLNEIISDIRKLYRISVHAEDYKERLQEASNLLNNNIHFIIEYIEKHHEVGSYGPQELQERGRLANSHGQLKEGGIFFDLGVVATFWSHVDNYQKSILHSPQQAHGFSEMKRYLEIFKNEDFATKYGIDIEKYKGVYLNLLNKQIKEIGKELKELENRREEDGFYENIIQPREKALEKIQSLVDVLLPLDKQQGTLLQREDFKGDPEAFDMLTQNKITIHLKTDGRYYVIGSNNIPIGISMSKEELDSIEIENNDYVWFRKNNGTGHSQRIC